MQPTAPREVRPEDLTDDQLKQVGFDLFTKREQLRAQLSQVEATLTEVIRVIEIRKQADNGIQENQNVG